MPRDKTKGPATLNFSGGDHACGPFMSWNTTVQTHDTCSPLSHSVAIPYDMLVHWMTLLFVRVWVCVHVLAAFPAFKALPAHPPTRGPPALQRLLESGFCLHTWTCVALWTTYKNLGDVLLFFNKILRWMSLLLVLYDNGPSQKMVLNTHLYLGPNIRTRLGGQLSSVFMLKKSLKFLLLRWSQKEIFWEVPDILQVLRKPDISGRVLSCNQMKSTLGS